MQSMKPITKKQITLVHVAKGKLALTENEYRAALQSVGVSSSKHLTQAQYKELMDHFKACGFVPRSKKPSGQTWRNTKHSKDKQALLEKIGAILLDLDLHWSYADSMALRMFKVAKAQWLGPRQLHKLAAALTYHQKRRQA